MKLKAEVTDEDLVSYQKHLNHFYMYFQDAKVNPVDGMISLLLAAAFACKNITTMDEEEYLRCCKACFKSVLDHKNKDGDLK